MNDCETSMTEAIPIRIYVANITDMRATVILDDAWIVAVLWYL